MTFCDDNMKSINQYSAFIALILLSLLSGCMTPPSNNTQLTVGPLSISKPTPIPELVQQILTTAKYNNGPASYTPRFYVRDCQVSDNPTTQYFREPNSEAMAVWGNSSIYCSTAIPIEAALEIILSPNLDFHVSPYADSGPCIDIGPPELVRDHPSIARRTYKIPKKRAKMLAKLPSRLSATGTCLAYDPKSGLLNVIDDEQDSTVGELLEAIGAKRIIRNPQIPEL